MEGRRKLGKQPSWCKASSSGSVCAAKSVKAAARVPSWATLVSPRNLRVRWRFLLPSTAPHPGAALDQVLFQPALARDKVLPNRLRKLNRHKGAHLDLFVLFFVLRLLLKSAAPTVVTVVKIALGRAERMNSTLVTSPMTPIPVAPVKVRQSNITIRFWALGCNKFATWKVAGTGVTVANGVSTGAKASGCGGGCCRDHQVLTTGSGCCHRRDRRVQPCVGATGVAAKTGSLPAWGRPAARRQASGATATGEDEKTG